MSGLGNMKFKGPNWLPNRELKTKHLKPLLRHLKREIKAEAENLLKCKKMEIMDSCKYKRRRKKLLKTLHHKK